MGRRRWKKNHPDKQRAQQEKRPEDAIDPPSRLLALQPGGSVVAVAIGTRVTLVDYKTGAEVKLAPPPAPAPAPAAPASAKKGKGKGKGKGGKGEEPEAEPEPAAEPAAEAAADAPASSSPAPDAPASAPGPALPHAGHLRVLRFSPDGASLLTGGDDKAARLWLASATPSAPAADASAAAAGPWRCIAAWRTPKKMSAGGFSQGGEYALFADKFGDVLVGRAAEAVAAATPAAASADAGVAPSGSGADVALQTPGSLLGHFCSIVTGVEASPCGRFLATSDKEFKVRVSNLPEDPMLGAYEIQCYCLGHQNFVSCIAFAAQPGQPAVLLSGGGDGTVRMWDYVSGAQLASYVAAAPVGAAAAEGKDEGKEEGDEDPASGAGGDDGDDEGDGEDGGEEGASGAGQGDGDGGSEPQRQSNAPQCAPVLSLVVSADGTTAAVVVEGDDEVQLLSVDPAGKSLSLKQRLRWPDVRYPCAAAFGPEGQLWVAGGVPLASARSVHIGVARCASGGAWEPCTEQVLAPAARALLEERVAEEEAQMAEGGELYSYAKRFHKPKFDEEVSEARKRKRNDFAETQRLAALRQRQDEQAKAKEGGKEAEAKEAEEAEVEAEAKP